jgi:3-oxoacid CoA-transferase B subunit
MSAAERILSRAVNEITSGSIVNLGIGLPTQVIHYLPDDFDVQIHSENGILGAWKQSAPEAMDPFLIDAAGAYVSLREGASLFDSAVSFAIIRRARLDLTMIGAFEVDAHGNLANWKIPGKFSPGIGGAMELAQKTKRIVVLTTHTDKQGRPKILKNCRLPLTAQTCVNRIISDLAVMDVTAQGLVVREKLVQISDADLQAKTEAELTFATRGVES